MLHTSDEVSPESARITALETRVDGISARVDQIGESMATLGDTLTKLNTGVTSLTRSLDEAMRLVNDYGARFSRHERASISAELDDADTTLRLNRRQLELELRYTELAHAAAKEATQEVSAEHAASTRRAMALGGGGLAVAWFAVSVEIAQQLFPALLSLFR